MTLARRRARPEPAAPLRGGAGTSRSDAYAPYSGFAVGAVVVGPSGRSHHGVNVENASYPAGLCAERVALAAMVAFGEREVRNVAVAAADGRDCCPAACACRRSPSSATPRSSCAQRRRGASSSA